MNINAEWEVRDQEIEIFSGEVGLTQGDKSQIVEDTKIVHLWYPSIRIVIKCPIKPDCPAFDFNSNIICEIDGMSIGDFRLLQMRLIDGRKEMLLESFGGVIFGDKSIATTKLNFYVPNLNSMHFNGGLTPKGVLGEENRLNIEVGRYRIKITPQNKDAFMFQDIQNNGGYYPTYLGEIESVGEGQISYDEGRNLQEVLKYYLCFLNGQRIAPLIMRGEFEGDTIWSDWSEQSVAPYERYFSFVAGVAPDGIAELFESMYSLKENQTEWEALITAIDWYVEANTRSGTVNGSLIMAQACLELLFNWIIVEDEKIIIGRDSENIQASNKIRLLNSYISLELKEDSDKYRRLELVRSENNLADLFEVVTTIRNGVVHGNKNKRVEGRNFSLEDRSAALDVSLEVIELVILKKLNYTGIKNSRFR